MPREISEEQHEQDDAPPSRPTVRYLRVLVSEELLLGFLTGESLNAKISSWQIRLPDGAIHSDSDLHLHADDGPIPRGTSIAGTYMDAQRGIWNIVLSHRHYPETPVGDVLPVLALRFTRENAMSQAAERMFSEPDQAGADRA